MDLSLQLQVPEQDLEEFPERPENLSSEAEPKYPLFHKKKRKRKSPHKWTRNKTHTPKTEEAKHQDKAPKIPCLLDIPTAPTPELVYALSREGQRSGYQYGRWRKGIRRFQVEGHLDNPNEPNESHGRISRKTRISYG